MKTGTVSIDTLAYGGRGVARLPDGKVCFVPGVLPGETVKVANLKDRGAFVEAHAAGLEHHSPHRIEPACPLACRVAEAAGIPGRDHTSACPGCAYQHVAYAEEVRLKHAQLLSLVTRQAGINPERVSAPQPAPDPLGYRNKMKLHAQKDGHATRLGYVAEDNQTVLDVPACPLACPPLNACLADRRSDRSFLVGLRDCMAVTFRWTERDGALWWRGTAGKNATWLVETTPLGPLAVPRDSFFQVNPAVSALLIRHVIESLQSAPAGVVMDLYCGVGLFALAAAQAGATRILGADVDGPGIEAAAYNARRLGVPGIQWFAGTAREALIRLAAAGTARETLLIVDPPRTGLGRAMVREIGRCPPGRLLYVSCAPDTLARDLAWLVEAGYTVRDLRLFDMFPRTPYFETVTMLERV